MSRGDEWVRSRTELRVRVSQGFHRWRSMILGEWVEGEWPSARNRPGSVHVDLTRRMVSVGNDGSPSDLVAGRVDECGGRDLVFEVNDHFDRSTGEDSDFGDWTKD